MPSVNQPNLQWLLQSERDGIPSTTGRKSHNDTNSGGSSGDSKATHGWLSPMPNYDPKSQHPQSAPFFVSVNIKAVAKTTGTGLPIATYKLRDTMNSFWCPCESPVSTLTSAVIAMHIASKTVPNPWPDNESSDTRMIIRKGQTLLVSRGWNIVTYLPAAPYAASSSLPMSSAVRKDPSSSNSPRILISDISLSFSNGLVC